MIMMMMLVMIPHCIIAYDGSTNDQRLSSLRTHSFFKIFQVQETETMAQRLHRNRETAFMKAEPFPSLSFPSFLFGSIGGPDSLLH